MPAVPFEVSKRIHDEVIAETEKEFCTKARVQKLRRELDLLAFSDLGKYEELLEGGKLCEIKPIVRRALKKIKRFRTTRFDREGNQIIEERTEIDLHPKMEAIGTLVDILGMKAAAKMEHEVNLNLSDRLEKAIQRAENAVIGK